MRLINDNFVFKTPKCWPSWTIQVIAELQEGYFPSELQIRYPKGIPLKVKDLREVKYVDPRMVAHFPGT